MMAMMMMMMEHFLMKNIENGVKSLEKENEIFLFDLILFLLTNWKRIFNLR